jgi:hypothetical protein
MNIETLSKLPDWPALMDAPTAIAYLGGSRGTLTQLETEGYLQRYANGNRAVRYLRRDIDNALTARVITHR